MITVRAPTGCGWEILDGAGVVWRGEPGEEVDLPVDPAWTAVNRCGFTLVSGTLPARHPFDRPVTWLDLPPWVRLRA